MKTTAFAGAVAASVLLAGIVGAHPVKNKRALVTEVTFATVTVANVIVWVDANGVPYETTTVDNSATTFIVDAKPTPSAGSISAVASLAVVSQDYVATSKPVDAEKPSATPVKSSAPFAPVVAVSSSQAPPPPAPSSQAPLPPAPSSQAPLPPAPSSQAPSPPAPSSKEAAVPSSAPVETLGPVPTAQAASSARFPIGVTYDPFKVGGCKTEDEISSELDNMRDFGTIRIYGMGCNVIPITVKHAKANNQKIMGGIYRSADPNNNEQIDAVVSVLSDSINRYAGGDWDIISMVSVENEQVNSHEMTASAAVAAIQDARKALRKAGYNGPVGAVETVPATVDNPSICAESDLALVNIHAFFDTHTSAKDAGDFVQGQIDQVKKACPNKRVVVTESGWPHQGDSHDSAVASPEAQKTAMDSIRSKFDHDVFLFNAFDSPWKTDDASTHNSEKFWGIL